MDKIAPTKPHSGCKNMQRLIYLAGTESIAPVKPAGTDTQFIQYRSEYAKLTSGLSQNWQNIGRTSK